MIELTDELKQQIREYALEEKPNEAVGLLVFINNKLILYKCKNISHHKNIHSILSPLDYVRAAKLGKIICHVHSHKESGTSIIDNLNAFNHKIYSIVYSWGYDKFYIIEPKLEDFINIKFEIGKNDCLSLVRGYYKNKLNININDYYRDKDWHKINPNAIIENFEKEGFYKVKLEDIKIHDLIVFNIMKIPSHLAIYQNDNFILHHPIDDMSIISELSPSLQKRIHAILRHQDIKYE